MKKIINNKINEEFRFKYYKKFDITEIKKEINKLNLEWSENTFRQDNYFFHQNTNTFFLADYDVDWVPYSKYNIKINNNNSKLWNLTKPVIDELESIHNGKIGKVMFVKLKAKNNNYLLT